MEISLLQAMAISAFYWWANISAGYGIWFARALMAGFVVGAVLGDVATGMKIGAVIQPMFLVFTGAGGTVVWDQCAGGVMGACITMAGGLPLDQALTVAVPVSILFAQIHTVRRIIFAYPATQSDKAAAKGNDRAIVFYGSYFCWMIKVVLYFVPMLLSIMLGAEVIGNLMANLPDWITNALSCVGGVLPSIGMAMTLRVIGRPKFLPFFLGGFFLVQYTEVGGLFLAFIGLFFSFMYYLILDATNREDVDTAEQDTIHAVESDENKTRLLTKKDCSRMFTRWWWYCEQSNSFARLQSIAYCIAFMPALKKLYGNDPEEYTAALQRHLMFFCTQGIWGSVIHGITLAMEEQRALGAPIGADAITGIKASLMGPFAGIGDTIDWATFNPLVYILFIPMAATGNPLGAWFPWLIVGIVTYTEGRIYSSLGFRLGTRAALNLLQGKVINTFISCASVLGLFMMGGLSASMVHVSTPLFIPTSGSPALVQSGILDKVAPGILPLCVVLGTYRYIMTGHSITKATLLLTAFGLIMGAIGILGEGGLIFKAYTSAV